MKKNRLLFLLVAILFSGLTFAQIPNAGFEEWTGGNPNDWYTDNFPPVIPITQTSSAHSGSSALQGTVVSYMGYTVPPLISSGSGGYGFPYTGHPGSFHGFYKLTSISEDYLDGTVLFIKNGEGIGGATLNLGAASNYTEFATDITWISAENPDSAVIVFQILGVDSVHTGTTFYLDDLSFSPATGVDRNDNALLKFELAQNYPNPFNPSTTINYSIPKQSFVSLKVYNLLGQEVTTLVNEEKSAGTYKTDFSASNIGSGNFASGIYLYRLTAGDLVQTKKMMLLK